MYRYLIPHPVHTLFPADPDKNMPFRPDSGILPDPHPAPVPVHPVHKSDLSYSPRLYPCADKNTMPDLMHTSAPAPLVHQHPDRPA